MKLVAFLVFSDRTWTDRLLRKSQQPDLMYLVRGDYSPPIESKRERMVASAEVHDAREPEKIFEDFASRCEGRVRHIPPPPTMDNGWTRVEIPHAYRNRIKGIFFDYFLH